MGWVETSEQAAQRFWSKVKIGDKADCWPWLAVKRNGYGFFSFHGKGHPSTRMAWYFTHGALITDRFFATPATTRRAATLPTYLSERTLTIWLTKQPKVVNFAATGITCQSYPRNQRKL